MSKVKYGKIRLTEAENKVLQDEAYALGITFSDLIRNKLGYPSKKQFQKYIFEMHKTGNNINQIAKALNTMLKIGKVDKSRVDVGLKIKVQKI